MSKDGTPKSIEDAIALALTTCPGPKRMDAVIEHFKSHISDFIAYRFGSAFINSESDQELYRLRLLLKEVTGRSV